jgi:hypothetical protein
MVSAVDLPRLSADGSLPVDTTVALSRGRGDDHGIVRGQNAGRADGAGGNRRRRAAASASRDEADVFFNNPSGRHHGVGHWRNAAADIDRCVVGPV